uniref:Uncharacterized protein n=2 Tax=Dunaliella tertiolecta TaxID=3047 RepID=A0A7S3R6G9_DUNTE|mmetsp:Transcript_25254/g.68653  ORF Transcript_25254/g.68653 Transcript_25254/m.68653 type:complete len:242 (+) Transcript_25254:172-897(+)
MVAGDTCGGISTLYTYPAWTFGGRHGSSKGPEGNASGPGTGKYASGMPWTAGTARMGPPRSPSGPYYTAGNTGNGAHLKPGGPAYSFGARLPGPANKNPGPLDYSPAWAVTAKSNPSPSFGPPPKPRPMSAPRPIRLDSAPPTSRRAKGPTFGLKHAPIKQDPVPGPYVYCDGGCSACNRYNGASFGLRPPTMYGQKHGLVGESPGPQAYHTGCSSIGAATRRCTSASPAPTTKSYRSTYR